MNRDTRILMCYVKHKLIFTQIMYLLITFDSLNSFVQDNNKRSKNKKYTVKILKFTVNYVTYSVI